MKRNPFLEQRKMRMEITKKILENMHECSLAKAVATVSINLGVKEETAKGYIKTLEKFDFLEINNGKIYLLSHSQSASHSVNEEDK